MANVVPVPLERLPDAVPEEEAARRVWSAYLDKEWETPMHAGVEFAERCKASVLFCADFFVVDVRAVKPLGHLVLSLKESALACSCAS